MKKFSFIPILLIFFAFADCKKKDTNSKPEQILGTRYSRYNHFIFTKPGAKDKKSQVALIYAFEEVTALEEVTEKGKSFFKVKSVIGKEGFAPSSAYCENVLVITGNDFPAFRKPTITAGIKTELSQAAICFVKENQGEWLFVDCLNIDYNKIKPEFYSSVWIQSKDERISKDPLLAQTAGELREGVTLFSQLDKSKDPEKSKANIVDKLTKSFERNDLFAPVIRSTLDSMNLVDSPPQEEVSPPDAPEEGEILFRNNE